MDCGVNVMVFNLKKQKNNMKFSKLISLVLICLFTVNLMSCTKKYEKLTPVEYFQKRLEETTLESLSMGEGLYQYDYYRVLNNQDSLLTEKMYLNLEMVLSDNSTYSLDNFNGNVIKSLLENSTGCETRKTEYLTYYNKSLYFKSYEKTNENPEYLKSLELSKFELENATVQLDIIQNPTIVFPIKIITEKQFDSEIIENEFSDLYRLTSYYFESEKGQVVFELVNSKSHFENGQLKIQTYHYFLNYYLDILKFSYREKTEKSGSADFEEIIINMERIDSLDIPDIDESKYQVYKKDDINLLYIKPSSEIFNDKNK